MENEKKLAETDWITDLSADDLEGGDVWIIGEDGEIEATE